VARPDSSGSSTTGPTPRCPKLNGSAERTPLFMGTREYVDLAESFLSGQGFQDVAVFLEILQLQILGVSWCLLKGLYDFLECLRHFFVVPQLDFRIGVFSQRSDIELHIRARCYEPGIERFSSVVPRGLMPGLPVHELGHQSVQSLIGD
jgi:hypothetical protein